MAVGNDVGDADRGAVAGVGNAVGDAEGDNVAAIGNVVGRADGGAEVALGVPLHHIPLHSPSQRPGPVAQYSSPVAMFPVHPAVQAFWSSGHQQQ